MIAEPYICTKGKPQGEIRWYQEGCPSKQDPDIGYWQPYADFEREKLRELGAERIEVCGADAKWQAYEINFKAGNAHSDIRSGYTKLRYDSDSESSRLLKRAEFLKAVCEKEGVTFLPKAEECVPPDSERPTLRKLLEGTPPKNETDIRGLSEKAQDCPYSCPRAAKLESRLAQHYYAKHEIDERISTLINHSDMPEDTKKDLRTRFL